MVYGPLTAGTHDVGWVLFDELDGYLYNTYRSAFFLQQWQLLSRKWLRQRMLFIQYKSVFLAYIHPPPHHSQSQLSCSLISWSSGEIVRKFAKQRCVRAKITEQKEENENQMTKRDRRHRRSRHTVTIRSDGINEGQTSQVIIDIPLSFINVNKL